MSGPLVLIASDDPGMARALTDLAAAAGMRAVQATADDDLVMVARNTSAAAVVLRFASGKLAGTARLDYLKHHPKTCHMPVHVIAEEAERSHALRAGAFGFSSDQSDPDALARIFERLRRIAEQDQVRLLVVQRGSRKDTGIAGHIPDGDGVATTLAKPGVACATFCNGNFAGVVIDASSYGQKNRAQLMELYEAASEKDVPVLIYGPELRLGTNGHAPDRQPRCFATPTDLLAEAVKVLKFPTGLLPGDAVRQMQSGDRPDPVLVGKRIAIIDDDIRNIFSLTAVLEQHQMEVVQAEDGRSGLELIEQTAPDVVLVDIMMPELDGYETIKRIRSNPRQASLPVLAVTAKAMKGDRELCLEAGATDYISKPINIPRLLATLRVWLRDAAGKETVEQAAESRVSVGRLH